MAHSPGNAIQQADDFNHSILLCLIHIARQHALTLTLKQLVHDHRIVDDHISRPQILECARESGLRAKFVHLNWNGLTKLAKALPAIVTFRNGGAMVIEGVDGGAEVNHVILKDPSATGEVNLVLDRERFEEAWTGDVILLKRDYEIEDEGKPFSFGLIATLIFRERRMVRDVAICAVMMSFLALSPIMFWRLLTDRVLYYNATSTFAVICAVMLILIAFDVTFGALRRYLILQLTTRVDLKLATYMFDKVLNLPVDFFERTQVGTVSHDMSEVWKIRNFLVGQMFGTVLDMGVLFVFLPVMAFFSPILTAIVLAFCALIFGWIVVMLPVARQKTGAVIAAETARGSFMIQTLQGIRTVKSLALDVRQRKLWDVLTSRVAKAKLAEGMTANLIQSVVAPLEKLMISGTFAVGVYMALATKDPVYVGALFAFLMLSQRVAAPLVQAAQLVTQFDEARAAVSIVGRLVNQLPEEGRTGHGVKSTLQGNLEFAKVRFSYKGALNPALNEVTFEIPQGTTLGVMGRSGSGKTTITRLLQRLHSDYTGLIKLDGIDVREFDVDHLRSSLGVVLQENFLFSGTIRENITIAKPAATYEEMVMAARMAGAEEFIDKLPRGYETYIFEGSPNLSGGQRQRLAIARALITDPRILILDEATSALDAESEAIVNANIERIAAGRTMIIISHRLSSLVRADAILVLDRGVVHDIGKHEELLDRCDIYSSLWYTQNQHAGAQPQPSRPKLVLRGPNSAA